jgi:hypothetical protein
MNGPQDRLLARGVDGAPFTRRALLRGVGATVALPWLESLARAAAPGARSLGAVPAAPPTRLAILYMPNGVLPSAWTPAGTGRDFTLSPTLEPLAPVRSEVLVLSGLCNANSRDGDGHYAKTAPFLTGAKIRRTGGRDLENGVSMDQVAAADAAGATPLSSLELGTEPVRTVEDMGYSTVYGGAISWRTPTTPNTKEIVPRLAFDRLFRSSRLRDAACEQSVLDVVRDDARRLARDVSRDDRRKLDEYLDSVRDLERRIAACSSSAVAEGAEGSAARSSVLDGAARPPEARPASHEEHVRLMLDLVVLAFQADVTRVATFMFGNAVSGLDMSFIDGVKGGHHEISHHENRPEKTIPYQRINRWHVGELARFLQRMAAIRDGDGTLLDHSLVVFGCAMRDGNAHDPNDLPIVVAGRGGGLPTGQHLAFPKPTPLCSLWLALLQRMGVEAERFGDSCGPLF